jgi:hypothetical protein
LESLSSATERSGTAVVQSITAINSRKSLPLNVNARISLSSENAGNGLSVVFELRLWQAQDAVSLPRNASVQNIRKS